MPIDFDIGDGADALGRNQLSDALDGTYWVSGWDATLGTGDLEVDIAAGEGAINGGDVSTGSTQTVDFTGDVDATNPRKAVISVDDTGTVQKTLGTAVPAAPTDEVRFRTYDPQPPTNAPGVVVAEVWLAAGATSLVSDDVRDRRVTNDASINATPNTPGWVEDANSPINVSGSQEATITLDGTYNIVLVHIQEFANTSGGVQQLQIRFNGVASSDYRYTDATGSETTGDTSFALANAGDNASFIGSFKITKQIFDELALHEVSLGTPQAGNVISTGVVEGSTYPVDSITLRGDSGAITAKFRVFGWNGNI
ncbi:hypothetical protein M196_gp71 [Halorubrum tailed virus 4]|uniref:Uncharacterized protein n=1 Tax=Halorubrum tailed virus 4 TaxID=1273752 RepID=R4TLX4_9CAUD|nr:hypothetical protein M196_gp71 [Halorubrum tailed virus 4]AGM11163.1 hypothetical protein HRTV4_71 [Halorubrum tailed virus 4]